jgi:hypothetical protein
VDLETGFAALAGEGRAVDFSFFAGAVLAFTAGFFLAVDFTIFFFFTAGLWVLALALVFELVMAFLRLATYRWRKRRALVPQANGRSIDLALGVQRMGITGPLSSGGQALQAKKIRALGARDRFRKSCLHHGGI